MSFTRINKQQARAMIESSADNGLQIADVRDERSFENGHIEGATHLHNGNIREFIEASEPHKPLLIYCYHGNMSQGAAAYFAEQGFSEAYSLDGGFEDWQS